MDVPGCCCAWVVARLGGPSAQASSLRSVLAGATVCRRGRGEFEPLACGGMVAGAVVS